MGVSELQMSGRIKNTDELEFAIFCIENLALRLKLELISAIVDKYLQYKGSESIC